MPDANGLTSCSEWSNELCQSDIRVLQKRAEEAQQAFAQSFGEWAVFHAFHLFDRSTLCEVFHENVFQTERHALVVEEDV